MDLGGIYDREFNKIKWSEPVIQVQVARPFLIGYLETGIEIKNVFNPNRVIQRVQLFQTQICKACITNN